MKYPSLRTGWLIVDGYPMYHRESRSAGDDAPAIVHVHGFGISGTYLEPTAARLTQRFRTFVPDLPGMGRSMRRERSLDLPDLAKALMSYCDAVGVETATFVGNSLGCPIICEIAASYPDRIERAVLVSPAGGPTNQPMGRAIGQMALDGSREPLGMVPIAVRDYLRFGVVQSWRLFKSMTAFPTLERVRHLDMPTLLVAGARDPLVHVDRVKVFSGLAACLCREGPRCSRPELQFSRTHRRPDRGACGRHTPAFRRWSARRRRGPRHPGLTVPVRERCDPKVEIGRSAHRPGARESRRTLAMPARRRWRARPMKTRSMETDYLVVGAGAMGMAFTDALIDHADVHVTLVDRRHSAGGHWHDAYPFVQLHQASAFYGVASTVLGTGAVQQDGPEAGLQERARRSEIQHYYDSILYGRFISSGRVSFLGGSDYHSDGASHLVTSRVSGETMRVDVRRRVVDSTYLSPTIPATTPPPFGVADGVRVVAVNELAALEEAPSTYVIVGSGKTATDGIVWLLANGVDPDRILWVRPREPWMLNRAVVQPDPVVALGLAARHDGSGRGGGVPRRPVPATRGC